jgi:hypothetical protein
MKVLLLLAAVVTVGLALSACQAGDSDPEKYKRSHDRYMDGHQPKSGGPDL